MTSEQRDIEQLQGQGEREADDMERRADGLKQDIQETRAEWDAKKSDATVPGAPPGDKQDEDVDDDEDD
jgi:hypothetical protein